MEEGNLKGIGKRVISKWSFKYTGKKSSMELSVAKILEFVVYE